MNSLSLSSMLSVLGVGVACVLTGCSANFTIPEAAAVGVPAAGASSLGAVQGSNYGGHAPIVGAHVFLLEGYASSGGYYQKAKSLLGPGETGGPDFYGSSYPTALEPAGTAVAGDYYVTTDARGDFDLSGTGYACDPGYPVYLYAEGGNPETNPTTGFTVNVTGASEYDDANGNLLVVFTTTGNQLLYQGEQIVFGSGIPAPYNAFNGTTQTVSTVTNPATGSSSLTTTTFGVELGPFGGANAPATFATTVTQYMPIVSNPAIVNLAVLGVCPSTGAANFNSLPFIYMNEVSTVAAAYALSGFFPAPGNANLSIAGAAAANLSVPSGDALALTGITNAALTAGQLYDIAGGNTGPGGDGETHIARATTPVGGGTVPQELIDTLGDALANCVDSANTSVVTANESAQCSTLFADTLSAGTSGTRPIDTATAAIDMAHNPWANATALVSSPTGNAPFQPMLATANDLSVGISYTPAHVSDPQGIAVDGLGQVWYTNFLSGYVTALSPLGGVVYNVQHTSGDLLGYVAIDPSGAAWYGDITAADVRKINAAGAYVNEYDAGGLTQPYGIASDGNGNIYLEDIATPSVYEFTNAGVLTTTPANPLTGASSCLGGQYHADHLATDNQNNGYNLWFTSELGDFVCEVNSATGALIRSVQVNAAQGAGTYRPEYIGIDSNGTAWFPDQSHNGMNKVTQAGVLTNPTGVTLSGGFGTAVDGAGNVFVSNRTSASIAEYLGSTSAAVSATTFEGGGNTDILTDPLNLAIDPSGNVWVADYGGSKIEEFVGLAAPTYTPLSVAALNNKLGSKP
jgi:streptogramin lyase